MKWPVCNVETGNHPSNHVSSCSNSEPLFFCCDGDGPQRRCKRQYILAHRPISNGIGKLRYTCLEADAVFSAPAPGRNVLNLEPHEFNWERCDGGLACPQERLLLPDPNNPGGLKNVDQCIAPERWVKFNKVTSSVPPPASSACTDTPGWNNGYSTRARNGHGFDCAFYAGAGNACAGGIAKPGFAWTLGPMFNNPELNCCACGKVHIHDAYERGLNARSPVNGRADVRCLHGCAEAAPPPPLPPGGGKCSDHILLCGGGVPQKIVAHHTDNMMAGFPVSVAEREAAGLQIMAIRGVRGSSHDETKRLALLFGDSAFRAAGTVHYTCETGDTSSPDICNWGGEINDDWFLRNG